MAFVKYPASITRAIEALEPPAATARKIKNDTGDLTFKLISRLFDDLEVAEFHWRTAIADAQRANIADVNAFLASIGGPTAATLQSQLNDLKTAKDAFGDALQTWLHNQPASLLVTVPTLTDADGNPYRRLLWGTHISDPTAQQLRDTQVVANLVTAFDALGV